MALRKSVIPVFGDASHAAKGSDAGVDPHHAQTDWLIAQNAVYPRRDASEKRPGTVRNATARGSVTRMEPLQDKPVLFGDGNFRVWRSSEDDLIAPENSTGSDHILDVTTSAYYRSEGSTGGSSPNQSFDIYDGGDWIALAGHRSLSLATFTSVLYVLDKQTKAPIDSCELSPGTANVSLMRFVKVGSKHQIYYGDALRSRDIAADGTIGAESNLGTVTSKKTHQWMDVCVVGTDVYVIVDVSGTWTLLVLPNGLSGSMTSIAMSGSGTTTLCGCWPIGSSRAVVAYGYVSGGTHTLYARQYVSTTPQTTSAIVDTATDATDEIMSVVGIDRSSEAYDSQSTVYWTVRERPTASTDEPAPDVKSCTFYDNSNVGTVTTAIDFVRRARIWTKPTTGNATADILLGLYVQGWNVKGSSGSTTVQNEDYPQATCLIVNEYGLVVGRIFQGVARTPARFPVSLSDPQASGYEWTVVQRIRVDKGEAYEELRTMEVVRIDKAAAAAVSVIQRDTGLLIAGACPLRFDGTSLDEQGFNQYPNAVFVETSGVSGNLTAGKTYQFVGVYEIHMSDGTILQSAPSKRVSYTPSVASETGPDVFMPTLPASRMCAYTKPTAVGTTTESRVKCVSYRTIGDGTTLYRDYDESIYSDPDNSVEQVASGLALSDADLQEREVLYTEDGYLENIPPPPHKVATLHRNRHLVVPAETNTDKIRYSKEVSEIAPPLHNEAFVHRVTDTGGQITGIVSHLDREFVFKAGRIYAQAGTYAAADGSGAVFADPQLVSNVLGCDTLRSLVETPQGWLFAAQDYSIWLLGQSGSPQPVGDRQRYFTDTYGPVTAAAALPDRHIVVFALNGASAPLLVYDWLFDRWSQWTTQTDTQDICAIDGTLYRLDTSGYIWTESATAYSDDDTSTEHHIPLLFRTGHIRKTATTDGWHHVSEIIASGYVLGSDFKLRIRAAYNQEPYFIDSKQINTSAMPTWGHEASYGAGSSAYEGKSATFKMQPRASKQACSAIMIEISDEEGASGTDDRGYGLTSLSLLAAQMPRSKRIGRARHVKDD